MYIYLPASLKVYLSTIYIAFFQRNLFLGGLALWCFIGKTQAQTIVWREDFSGANQGWTQNFTDCEIPQNGFAGVRNGRFEIQDMEGTPCCTIGGGNNNVWSTNQIPLTSNCTSISIEYGYSGTMECSPNGPYFTCTGDAIIDNAHDQMVIEYRLDNGNWVQMRYVCGGASGVATATGLAGQNLEIRVRAACKSLSELYWFDNIVVSNNPVIQLTQIATTSLTGSFTLTGGLPQTNGSNYASVVMALQINPGVVASLITAPFTHNETVTFTCPEAGTYVVTVSDATGCTGIGTVVVQNSGIVPQTVFVQGGKFSMGSECCDPSEMPARTVYVKDYEIGKYEVTQSEWQSIMGANPSYFPCGANCPVEKVGWYDAIVFCNKLSVQQGLTPCYYSDLNYTNIFGWNGSNWTVPKNVDVYWKMNARGFRLPTESEWEYAAQGGNKQMAFTYSGNYNPDSVAWYGGNSLVSYTPNDNGQGTHPIGLKKPNSLGLYDMSGNAWEWCFDMRDWVGTGYYSSDGCFAEDGCYPVTSGIGNKIIRGGGCTLPSFTTTTTYRFATDPTTIGFRAQGLRIAKGEYELFKPNCVQMISPSNGDGNINTGITIRWKRTSICTDRYRISIGTTPNGKEVVASQITRDTFFMPALPLPGNTKIFVQIVPINRAGEGTNCGEFSFTTGASKGLFPDLVDVPMGQFNMGCTSEQTPDCYPDELPVRKVMLNGFSIGRYEVTQAKWEEVMGNNPSYFTNCSDNFPVEQVSWYDIVVFCNKLSSREGLQFCYFSDSLFTKPYGLENGIWILPNSGNVYWNTNANGYRLPSESEWEFAARGGQLSNGYKYSGGPGLFNLAWEYNGGWTTNKQHFNGRAPHEVGLLKANELGIHDMTGNVWEWCFDWFGDSYLQTGNCAPLGKSTGTSRIFRGGSWRTSSTSLLRNALRNYDAPSGRGWNVGFRICKGVYLPSSPSCIDLLIPTPFKNTSNINTIITWKNSSCADVYHISLSTTPGGTDLLNNLTVVDTFFQPIQPLPQGDTIYVRITPRNRLGQANGCDEFWFVTSATCATVTTTADTGPGSFREAVECAKNNPGPDTIRFALTGNGPHVIALQSLLYAAADTGGLVIDATTQANWQAGQVVIDGSTATNVPDGLIIFENYKGLEIYGLTFRNAPTGMLGLTRCQNIRIGAPGKGNLFYGNEDGVPAAGPVADPGSYASNIQLFGCTNATLQANTFGLTETNGKPARNMVFGLTASGQNLLIGGSRSAGAGNTFAYALQSGLGLWADGAVPLGTRDVRIYGNNFGTDATGSANWGNFTGFEFGTNTPSSSMQAVHFGGHDADFVNVIQYNTRAVGEYGTALKQVQFGRNTMACNDAAVALCCNPQRATTISSAQTQSIAGTATPGDSVTVYISQNTGCPAVSACQGTVWLGKTAANAAGAWSLSAPFARALAAGESVTAIGTGAGQSGAFSACAVVEAANTCRYRDSLALVAFYNATGGPNWISKWDMTKPMKTWYGITTNAQGCVTNIDLDGIPDGSFSFGSGNNLTGILPPEIGELSELKTLCIAQNKKLTGNIPAQIGNLTQLEFFYAHDDSLSGSIPSAIGNLKALVYLQLGYNNLTGAIPTAIGSLPKLVWLNLMHNQLSGSIPRELGNLSNLEQLWLFENQLTGEIPPEIGQLTKLTYFWAYSNQLTGSIPPSLGALPNLRRIYLHNNNLSGCFDGALLPICTLEFSTDIDQNGYNFSNNPNLPWQGDFKRFCDGEMQIGALCNDENSNTTNDVINANCQCAGTLVPISGQDTIAPCIQWQQTLGGSNNDLPGAIVQSTDKGYILAGWSLSDLDGDKTDGSQGSYDYWIVKINETGQIAWQNTIGGSGDDRIQTVASTTDGGSILGGYSTSNISGDKTENSQGSSDYWVIKLDPSGNIVWQNTIGGNNNDALFSIQQTSDGGYILGGESLSGLSGDKTEPSKGNWDYWIVKLDATGNIIWQKSIGGNREDICRNIRQTSDGGYILCGQSRSTLSGDKTENGQGNYDFWVLKLDAEGNIVWQNTIGGGEDDSPAFVEQTSDGGYLLCGSSLSDIGGDKTENNRGNVDYWIVKLNNTGTIIWQKTIGGSNFDIPVAAFQLSNGNYVVGGRSNSNISGDKTENSKGGMDAWIVQLSPIGEVLWQKTIGGSGNDVLRSMQRTVDMGYILGGESDSNISGDKSQDSRGGADYWAVKLNVCTVPCTTVTTTTDAGPGSFREALACANANPGPDTIRFNLPGAGPHVIDLSSPLPNITGNGTVILGQSQPGWSLGNLVLDGANLATGTAVLGVLADSFEVYGLHIRDGSVGIAVYNRNNIKIGNQFAGNVTSGAKSNVGIEISGSTKCQIEGNVIGLDPTASAANSPQMCCAIRLLKGQSNNTDIQILKNTLGGTKNEALYIEGSNVTVRDNAIGTNAAGTLNLGNGTGIKVGSPSSKLVKIGGNQIGFSSNDGIVVDSAQQVDIYANSLFCNTTTGIRLLPGANANVPKPLIVSAISGTVSGTSPLSGAGRIEIFKSQNTGCPTATCAQGKVFLGWADINNLSSWTFSSAQIQAGDLLSATMTLDGGNFEGHTSAFSDCFAVAAASCTTVTNTADNGPGSLREAINCANTNPGPDTIRFNILGGTSHEIAPITPLPWLTDHATVIDGTTQPSYNPVSQIPLIQVKGRRPVFVGDTLIHIQGKGCEIYGLSLFNAGIGVLVAGDSCKIGRLGGRNVIGGNYLGISQRGASQGLEINNNYIGIAADGRSKFGNLGDGVILAGFTNTFLLRKNVISGNYRGVAVINAGRGTILENIVGVSADTSIAIPNSWGLNIVNIDDVIINQNIITNNIIGIKIVACKQFYVINNIVRNNPQGAVTIGSSSNIKLSRNQIYCNGFWGIQLEQNGNLLKQAPKIDKSLLDKIEGTSTPGDTIEVFVQTQLCKDCENNIPQGATFLGNTVTDSAGKWSLPKAQFTFTPLLSQRITATSTDAAGNTSPFSNCSVFTDCASVLASAGPDVTSCISQPLTLTASGGTTYQWSDGGPATAQWSFTPSITKTYRVTATDANGCTGVDSVLVTVSSSNALIVVQDTLTCTKTSATLTASGGGTYTWSNGLGNNATATANTMGTYTVTVTGANGCTATASATVIEQKALPTASASGGVLTCTNPVTTLQGNSVTPGAVFVWSGPGGFAFNGPNPPVSLAGTYTLTARAPNGCTTTATALVLADNTLPVADIQAPGGLQIDCIRANLSLQATNAPGNTYNWSGPNGFTFNGLQATVSMPGTYMLTVRNPTNGCANSSTATVGSSTAKPNLSATGGTLTCGSAFVILQGASTTPNATFAWAGPNGFAIAQQNPPVNVAGTYTLTVRDPANGCTATATAAVLADMTQPNATIATPLGTTITCRQPSATLQAPFNADYTYQWSGNLGNGNSASAIQVGTYTVTVTNTLNNCSATGTVAVSINTAPPVAAIATPQGTLVDCRQLALALQGSGGDAYAWSGPGGFAFNGPQPTVGLPGNYLLVVTNNANGCTGSAAVSITGNTEKPAGIMAIGGALTCTQSSVVLNGSSTTLGVTYAWIGPGGTPYTGATPSVGTTGTYTLVVSDPANGCSGTATAAVVSNTTTPAVNAVGGTLGCISHACQLQSGSTSSGATFVWSGPGNFSSALPNPVVTLTGNYTLVVLDPANGCSSSRSIVVTPEKQLKPTISGPTAFCGGAAVVLSADVGFSQYQWSNGATTPTIPVSQGGVYRLSVADLEGCTGTASVTVVEHPAAVASLVANEGSGVAFNDQVICAGETIQFTADGGALYQFYRNGQVWGGFTSNPVLSATNIANGEMFSVRIQDSNGCRDTTTAGEGPGYAPISVQVNPLPDWTGAGLTMVRACPNKPVLLLLSCPKLPNGIYSIDYLLYGTNNLSRLNDTLLVQNGSALIDLGLLPNAGNTTIRLFGIRNAAACVTVPLSGNTLTFANGIGSQTVVEKTICKGQTFAWGGNTYSQSGNYTHTETSLSGCDSTVVLQLNVVTVLKESLAATICQGKSYTFNGQSLTKAGIYIDSLKSFGGCDSLVTLALSVLPAPFSTLAKTICPGESFVLGGVTYDKTGTYTATLKTPGGCDSLVVLSLSVKALAINLGAEKTVCTPTTFTLNATVPNCPDCTYTWAPAVSGNPSELIVKPAATSTYAVTVKDNQQCTATDQLRINVQDNIETKVKASICKGETYKLGNVVLKDPGEYDLELTTTAGCDSLIRLKLEVLNPGDYQTRPDTGYLLPDERYKDFDVLDNDRYLEDRALSIARQGRQGLAEIKDGLLRFTPNNNFLGYDTVWYALCPSQGCPQVCDTGFLLVLVQSGELEDLVNIMPNTITPNGDGQNDTFDPLGFLRLRGLYIPDEVTEMAIVSRQGEVIFHPKRGEYRAWDATHKGREVTEGTYYYWLRFGDEPPIKGPVTVIR